MFIFSKDGLQDLKNLFNFGEDKLYTFQKENVLIKRFSLKHHNRSLRWCSQPDQAKLKELKNRFIWAKQPCVSTSLTDIGTKYEQKQRG